MKKVLIVDGCISTHKSRTKVLLEHLIEKLIEDSNDSLDIKRIEVREGIFKGHTPESLKERDAYIKANDFSHKMFEPARDFADSDIIIFAVPYWDLSFPAAIKVYIENLMVPNLTFRAVVDKFEGMCKAENIYYVTSSGGSIGFLNLGYEYVKEIGKMLGIKESKCFMAESLDIAGNDSEAIMKEALKVIDDYFDVRKRA